MDYFLTKKNYANAHLPRTPFYLDNNNDRAQEFLACLTPELRLYFMGFVTEGAPSLSSLRNADGSDTAVIMTQYSRENIDTLYDLGFENIYYLRECFSSRKLFYYEKEFRLKHATLNPVSDEIFSRNLLSYCAIEGVQKIAKIVEEKGATFSVCLFPQLIDVKNKSPYESRISLDPDSMDETQRNEVLTQYGQLPFTCKNYLFPIIKNGLYCNQHVHSQGINTKNGFRVTLEQPEEYTNTLYLLGSSTIYGYGVVDKDTLASNLQRILNEVHGALGHRATAPRYRVESATTGFEGVHKHINLVRVLPLVPGDLVILFEQTDFVCSLAGNQEYSAGLLAIEKTVAPQSSGHVEDSPFLYAAAGISCTNLLDLFDRPHDYGEIYADHMNLTPNGHKALAEAFYSRYLKHKIVTQTYAHEIDVYSNMFWDDHKRFAYSFDLNTCPFNMAYVNYLKNLDISIVPDELSGAIVMNCNPFTLGHKYLITRAASEVDHLYVFVVEENLSHFPFEDRFRLVQQGVVDIPGNITVIPSGTLISRQTYPGYFGMFNFLSPEVDIENFAENIAPIFNITVRFAGTEPLSPTTEIYNRFMEEILPRYNIAFVEIERKRIDDDYISASRVRQALQDGDVETVRKLVPETTFTHICAQWLNTPEP